MNTFIHVGCGPKRKQQTTRGFNTPEWSEVRLDIDLSVQPDVQGTMTDMAAVATGSMTALYSSHNIEHLSLTRYLWHSGSLCGCFADGFVVLTCPDLQSVCALVAEGKLTEATYSSPAGPIQPYSVRPPPAMANGNLYMAHRCGFTEKVLIGTLQAAGFTAVVSRRRPAPFWTCGPLPKKAPLMKPVCVPWRRLTFQFEGRGGYTTATTLCPPSDAAFYRPVAILLAKVSEPNHTRVSCARATNRPTTAQWGT